MERKEIEIRTSELDIILGKTPGKLMRNGIGIICICILVLVVGSMFFYYPDTISCEIRITTNLPPSLLVTKTGGLIEKLYVRNEETVEKGQILAVFENPARTGDVLRIRTMLDSLEESEAIPFMRTRLRHLESLELGDITGSFSELQKTIENYESFYELRTYAKKDHSLKDEILHIEAYADAMQEKYRLACLDCEVVERGFKRDSILFCRGAATAYEYEQTKSMFYQKKAVLMDYKAQVENIRIQRSQLEYTLMENQNQAIEQETLVKKELDTAYKKVGAELNLWVEKYAVVAPFKGKVSFAKYWSEGQYVTIGEEVLTVIPMDQDLIGKLVLQPAKSGKVKIGQSVNIKLDGYPYMEYGTVKGCIHAVSLMPSEKNYLVDVYLPQKLQTNYGITLNFSQEMSGKADIITEDMTLFERLCNPVRTVLKNIKK